MTTEAITRRLQTITDLKNEIAKVKALYEEKLEEDDGYQEMQEEASKMRAEIKDKKVRVLSSDEYLEYDEQLKDLRREVKEHRAVLAQELADYYRESGKLEITDPEGNTKKVKFSVTLVDN
jgi:DNA repair exonuclease SbcCD nuclease subunit